VDRFIRKISAKIASIFSSKKRFGSWVIINLIRN